MPRTKKTYKHTLKMQLSSQDLKKLRSGLPYGSKKKIAAGTGKNERAVISVLNGDYYNEDIINEAIKIVEAEKQRVAAMQERIRQAVGKGRKAAIKSGLKGI